MTNSVSSSIRSTGARITHDGVPDGIRSEHQLWSDRARIVLTPVAAPSIMGLTGFMLATVMVGAWQAGWYGGATTPAVLWPFALFAGGALQAIAATASFRARDGVAVAVHTAWGVFWTAWGVLQLMVATGNAAPIVIGSSSPAFAFWFVGLALITFSATLAALGSNIAVSGTLAALTGGSAVTAGGLWAGSAGAMHVGGWFFVVSAALAWYTVTAMVLEHGFGRTIVPVGALNKRANVPGRHFTVPVEYASGMPGSRVGQ
jgi:uncharacterized protein